MQGWKDSRIGHGREINQGWFPPSRFGPYDGFPSSLSPLDHLFISGTSGSPVAAAVVETSGETVRR